MSVQPPLDEGDVMALNFYFENATAFVRDFGLMPGFLGELGLEGGCRRVFRAKLNKIHDAMEKMRGRGDPGSE